jgi:hypothetical protein
VVINIRAKDVDERPAQQLARPELIKTKGAAPTNIPERITPAKTRAEKPGAAKRKAAEVRDSKRQAAANPPAAVSKLQAVVAAEGIRAKK